MTLQTRMFLQDETSLQLVQNVKQIIMSPFNINVRDIFHAVMTAKQENTLFLVASVFLSHIISYKLYSVLPVCITVLR